MKKRGKMKNTSANILITTNAMEKGGFLEIPYNYCPVRIDLV
jgi:hypothetical protein